MQTDFLAGPTSGIVYRDGVHRKEYFPVQFPTKIKPTKYSSSISPKKYLKPKIQSDYKPKTRLVSDE